MYMKTFRTTEITTPLSAEQISQYERDGYLVVSQGCSKDLIHAYNSHIYNIRSAENVVDWAKQSPNQQLNDDGRFSLRLVNRRLHDSFSDQRKKPPILRGALAQLWRDEAVGIQCTSSFK